MEVDSYGKFDNELYAISRQDVVVGENNKNIKINFCKVTFAGEEKQTETHKQVIPSNSPVSMEDSLDNVEAKNQTHFYYNQIKSGALSHDDESWDIHEKLLQSDNVIEQDNNLKENGDSTVMMIIMVKKQKIKKNF